MHKVCVCKSLCEIFHFRFLYVLVKFTFLFNRKLHPATRRRSDVVTTSLCASQRCRSYVSNETSNDVSVERRQDVSVVRLRDILLERRGDVSRGRNDVPSVRLLEVSTKSQMKHPTKSQWYVSLTSH